jgi:hypothetical protein
MNARLVTVAHGLALVALAALAAPGCRSSEPIPPSLPLVVPEPERPEPDRDPERPRADRPSAAERAADAPPTEIAADHVVAPEGDDRADGSAESPWRTLAHAASQVGPGATVLVRPGRYRGLELTTSGEPGRPIRFIAEAGAIIEAPDRPDGINLEGASYVEIRGFRITGASRAGIRAVDCEHVTIRDNRVDRNGKWGILTGFCDDVRILGNEASRSREQHGIYVGNTTARPLVEGNTLWGNQRAGLHMNGDRHMGGDGVIREARVIGNVIRDNGRDGAAAINLDGVRDSLIANNLLHGNVATGIAVYRIDGGEPSTGNAIVHNTIVMPRSSRRWALLLRDGAAGTSIYNNIIVTENSRRGAILASADSLPGLASDANLITDRLSVDEGQTILDLQAWRARTGQDARSATAPDAAALFVEPRRGDFRLAANSPARGAGVPLPRSVRVRALDLTARDLAGTARPEDDAPDLGCYQEASSADEGESAAAR